MNNANKYEYIKKSFKQIQFDLRETTKGMDNYVVRIVHPVRYESLKGAIADAILEIQKSQNNYFLLLYVSSIGRLTKSVLHEYSSKYLPDLRWIVIDDKGTVEINNGSIIKVYPNFIASNSTEKKIYIQRAENYFKPLNQSLLKTMVCSMLNFSRTRNNHKYKKNYTQAELASTGISIATVSNFIRTSLRRGYIKKNTINGRYSINSLMFYRILDDWSTFHKITPGNSVNAVPVYNIGINEILDYMMDSFYSHSMYSSDYPNIVIGGFLALNIMNICNVTNFNNCTVYTDSIPKTLNALQLEPAAERHVSGSTPSVRLIEPYAKKSVFEKSKRKKMGKGSIISYCDPVQAYLDIRFCSSRGAEQAEYLKRNIFILE